MIQPVTSPSKLLLLADDDDDGKNGDDDDDSDSDGYGKGWRVDVEMRLEGRSSWQQNL